MDGQRSGDVDLPLAFRTVRYTGLSQLEDRDRVALMYGPILMALTGKNTLEVPVALDLLATELPGRLTPVAGKPLHFSISGLDGCVYQPYWQIQKEHFTCYPAMRWR